MFRTARINLAIVIIGFASVGCMPATAKSIKDFDTLPSTEQSRYMVGFLEKMTYDLGRTNPKLAQDIKDYFVRKEPGKPFSEGLEKVFIELAAVETLAKEGKADLSKIQVESLVVYVVKQKFPPPNAEGTSNLSRGPSHQ